MIDSIKKSIQLIKNFVQYEDLMCKLNIVNNKLELPNIWDKPEIAIGLTKEKDKLESIINSIVSLENEFHSEVEFLELAQSENNQIEIEECNKRLCQLAVKARKLQLDAVLNNEKDELNCFLEINAGAGGTEAQDWAEMLARMYKMWAENKRYRIEITNESRGEEAGVKSITLHIIGNKAYGWLKRESGVHRLVRISPFDSNARRHTSFAAVLITPELDNSIKIEIKDEDLRIDVYRSSGAGGQHVNKTESAVRITHIPTGIVTASQVDRSQHKNREIALNMLKAKLYTLELQKKQSQQEEVDKADISWGNQIRSYVLHPYQLVKDLRTGIETSNTTAVLNGEIDNFLEAEIAMPDSNG